jgi:[acyl-carrier-protein] S-malonyltransferase
MSYAVLFPGQGSQAVGMGADVFAARPDLLGDAANEILGWDLAGLCREGPEGELVRTDRAQPALFAVSFALWEAFGRQAPAPPAAAAGHSLGEYTALAAAGVLTYGDGLRLVAARGEAMAGAAGETASGMAALLGTDIAVARTVCRERREAGGSLWVANDNAPGQVVVAGGVADLDWLDGNARRRGIRRVIRLNVAGAFHSPFMAGAATALTAAVARTDVAAAAFPVWANATAAPHVDTPASLVAQLTSPVRFAESLTAMHDTGITAFVHIGPGDVTAGMARRTLPPDVAVFAISALDDIAAVCDALSVHSAGSEGGIP